MIRFQRSPSQQVCGPCNTFFMAVAFALSAALPLASTALASDRSLHLHAASHSGGRLSASGPASERGKSSRHAPTAGEARKPKAKTPKNSAHKSKVAPPEKAHGKATRRHRRESEVVDNPIMVHRAEAKPLSRKAAAKERQLARQRGTSRAGENRHGHTELAEARRDRRPSFRGTRSTGVQNRDAAHPIVLASKSLSAAVPNRLPRVPLPEHGFATGTSRGLASPQLLASSPTETYRQGESHPEDDGDVSYLQGAATHQPATRSVVVRSQPDNEGQVTAASITRPAGIPARRVITGFGAEVAAAPGSAASRYPIDAFPPVASQQQQMDIADDTESEKLADTSPHALAEDAMQPLVLPMYARNGKLMMPAPLRGSREILVHQNTMADHDGLERIQNDRELNRLRQQRMLVGFPESASLRVNYGLPENRRYARPWTVRFAADAARAFYAQFGEPLQVNSAVRTVAYQVRLQRVNGNAAATRGDGASPHLTGQAIDLAKRGMTSEEIGWMRTYLLPLMQAGKVDVEEEFQQACFHISVYRAYLPAIKKQPAPRMQVAQLRLGPRVEHTLPATPPTNEPNDQ